MTDEPALQTNRATPPPERFETSDGVGVVYRSWGSQRRGPVVVLHHGFSANAILNWELPGVVAALCSAGRRVVALDARGHGESDAPHGPESYGEARMARDLHELCDSLGLEEFDLAGYSMGGVVASISAAQDARVRRLVISGVGESVVDLGGVDTRVFATDALVEILCSGESATAPDPGVAAFLALAAASHADRRALAAQALAFHKTPVALDAITAPTLVIAGDADPLAAHPERLAAAIPNARSRVVPGDHFTAVGHPDFAAEIVAFFD